MEAPDLPVDKREMSSSNSVASFHQMSTMESEMDMESIEKEEQTSWRCLIIATIIGFLCSVENNIITMGEFPYMTFMDNDTTSSFFGFVNSACRVGHALFALMFAFWSHKMHITKLPLLTGRFIALAGCLLYLMIEYVPTNRRYAMLFCYFLFGIGFSTSPLLRSYVSRMSGRKQRTSAYAMFNTASIFSVIIGPIAQLSFSGINYPGYEIFPGMRFHIYSAPVWIALITNIIAIAVVAFCFDDPPPPQATLKKAPSTDSFSLEGLKQKWAELKKAPFNWSLVFVILFEKMIINLTLCTLHAIASPMMMAVFAFDGPFTIKISAVAQFIVGIMALTLSALFIVGKLGKHLSSRLLFAFALFIVIILYITSYPYDFTSRPMQPFNETTRTGCNPKEYSWCDTAKGSSPLVWIPILIIVMGFAFPSSVISLDAVYSKVLGNIDQSLMQGAIVVAEDVVLILGPIYAAETFTKFGMGPLWVGNGIVVTIGFVAWIAFWRPLEEFSSRERY